MYMSQIQPGNSLAVRALLSNPNKIHGIIEHSFEGERESALWRMDTLHGEPIILILSKRKPDFTNAAVQLECKSAETIDYDRFLDNIKEDAFYRFRLAANPVFRSTTELNKKGKGKLLAIAGVNERDERDIQCGISGRSQTEWLTERAERNGFELAADGFTVVKSDWLDFYKDNKKHHVHIKKAVFEGVLRVTDLMQFRKALTDGIGREKAYGCGLLTVMKYGS
jgi:CRISPR system Cascade subunit CasE